MGRLDLVREMVTDEGSVRDGVPLFEVPWLRFRNDAQANLELAAVWARIHGHPEVEAYLVQRVSIRTRVTTAASPLVSHPADDCHPERKQNSAVVGWAHGVGTSVAGRAPCRATELGR